MTVQGPTRPTQSIAEEMDDFESRRNIMLDVESDQSFVLQHFSVTVDSGRESKGGCNMEDDDSAPAGAPPADSNCVITLNNGTVLVLREVNRSLALVCILKAQVLAQQGILEYNFRCFRDALGERGAGCRVRVLGIPTEYIPHGDPDEIHARFGLDGSGIAASVRELLD